MLNVIVMMVIFFLIPLLYKQLVGNLNYFIITRPEIFSVVVMKVSQYAFYDGQIISLHYISTQFVVANILPRRCCNICFLL